MPDSTNDTHIEELLDNLGGGYWPEKHAALTALVAERNALNQRVVELEAQEFTLPHDPFRDADRDLRERLVCAALTGLCADPNMNVLDTACLAVEIADEALAAMRKGDTNGK